MSPGFSLHAWTTHTLHTQPPPQSLVFICFLIWFVLSPHFHTSIGQDISTFTVLGVVRERAFQPWVSSILYKINIATLQMPRGATGRDEILKAFYLDIA